MLELEEALERILSTIQALGTENLPLLEANNRYLASPIISEMNLPLFDNSAMDGFAVRAEDVAKASPGRPVHLKLVGKIAAGELPRVSVPAGGCIRIFTGSPIPQGASAVVMQEDTRIDPSQGSDVAILDPVKPWENVRFAGEDIKRGAVLIKEGEQLNPALCSLAAACGFSSLRVFRRPVVGLLATGNELVSPGDRLAEGQIYESNRVGIALLAQRTGASPKLYPLVRDSLEATIAALSTAFEECDAVITSGGVSVGEWDFVKAAFASLGGELSFWKVAIKPGKPFVFGRLRNKWLFGLPGNPVSALVTGYLLVRPALLRMQGATQIQPLSHPVLLSETVENPGDRRHFVRISIDVRGNAKPTGIQASHILSSLAGANGLLDVPPKTVVSRGSTVLAIRWD